MEHALNSGNGDIRATLNTLNLLTRHGSEEDADDDLVFRRQQQTASFEAWKTVFSKHWFVKSRLLFAPKCRIWYIYANVITCLVQSLYKFVFL